MSDNQHASKSNVNKKLLNSFQPPIKKDVAPPINPPTKNEGKD